ncbi:MAG: class I SAM-dependent methyltransferase [Cyanobacteriota bacterium]
MAPPGLLSPYVQYGCGLSVAMGWRNFDGSPRLRVEKLPVLGRALTRNRLLFPPEVEFGDIVRGLPIAAGSCKGVYCSHVLEHLCFRDCLQALRNTRAILEPGGIFRLVIPDLEEAIQHYLHNPSPQAAADFMRETCLGLENRPRGLKGMLSAWLGNSPHLWMWDAKAMRQALEEAGFVDIRPAVFGDATDPMFANAEEWSRWKEGIGFDCRRPV